MVYIFKSIFICFFKLIIAKYYVVVKNLLLGIIARYYMVSYFFSLFVLFLVCSGS